MKQRILWGRRHTYTGAEAHERIVLTALKKHYKVILTEMFRKKKPGFLANSAKAIIYRIRFMSEFFRFFCSDNVKILDFYYTAYLAFMPKKGFKISLVHHIDKESVYKAKLSYSILERLFFIGLKKSDMIVVEARFWKEYFAKKGFKNIFIIHNVFEMDEYNIASEEVEKFKKSNHIDDKPIIYLGNCQQRKGVVESYNALKSMNAHLITSGQKEIDIPAKNMNLDFRGYLTLLKASSVVITMSKFNEGWCRTAHEALLLKTPVIGSGRGGMGELLDGSSQMICKDFRNLQKLTVSLVNNPKKREEQSLKGYRYAKSFETSRMEKDWLKLIESNR